MTAFQSVLRNSHAFSPKVRVRRMSKVLSGLCVSLNVLWIVRTTARWWGERSLRFPVGILITLKSLSPPFQQGLDVRFRV